MIAAGAFTLVTLVLLVAAAILVRWTGSLMDHGDGQGGVPPLPRRTGQPPLADLVVVDPRMERLVEAAWECLWCTPGVPLSVAAPEDCTCKRRCTAPYCAAPQRVAERGLA